ncbi:MAG: hypothetical protein H6557_04585 [Lewinellaceae bacterium]|nr:hypothetical protein [Phaeodactylibacter sp.]MCB9035879.1 hypothetical protein [Lewinellaceae bacterium]
MSTLFRIALLAGLNLAVLSAQAQYQAIDRHARRAPDTLLHALPQLVGYLAEPAENEREKARSLYAWLAHNIAYDEEASRQDRRINQNIEDILRRGRGLCFDYSLLYAELCRLAGLQCVSVSGYSRQGLEAMEMPPAPDHSWNAIFLDGHWQLIDVTWGASPGQDALMAVYGADYFLSPPRLFILNHLPAQPMWQLLPCPVGPAEFCRPADALAALVKAQDSCYNYPDTIRAFLQHSGQEQSLLEAESAYRFHSTAKNQAAWAQSLLDYAVYLSEQASPLQQADSLKAFLKLQAEAISYCRKAQVLAPFLPWQTEFYAGLLVNQAVALNQQSDKVRAEAEELALLKEARKNLEEAKRTLLALPADNYYRQYAEQQCAAYLEAIAHNIRRLE